MDFFDDVAKETLDLEGDYSDVKGDRGGRTKYGVTEKTFKKAIEEGTITGIEDISELTVDHAKTIYRAMYWTPIMLEKIGHKQIAGEIFDTAVNMGTIQAVYIAQLSLDYLGENIVLDGIMGPNTVGLINKWAKRDPRAFFKVLNGFQFVVYACLVDENLIDLLKSRITGDSYQQKFAAGWMQRIQDYKGGK